MAAATITGAAPTRDSSATLAKLASTTHDLFTFECPKAGKFGLLVEQTGTLSSTLVVLAGTGLHASQGDLTACIARSSTWVFGPLSTSRFKSGTSINIIPCPSGSGTGVAGFSGNLAVITLP